MKIREFQVHRYGPLAASGRVALGPFNLFWGENEDGKTLTVEALVKLLFGRKANFFEGIERVPEEPDGYIVLESSRAEEIKLEKFWPRPRNFMSCRNCDYKILCPKYYGARA